MSETRKPLAPGLPDMTEDEKREVDRITESFIWLYSEGRKLLTEHSSAFGLTPSQLAALKILESLGGLRVSDLGDRMRTRASTVTGVVDRMARDGLVERKRDTEDRRVVFIHLTDKGRELATSIPSTPTELVRAAVESLTFEEQQSLLKIVGKLGRHLSELMARVSDGQEVAPDGAETGAESGPGAAADR